MQITIILEMKQEIHLIAFPYNVYKFIFLPTPAPSYLHIPSPNPLPST